MITLLFSGQVPKDGAPGFECEDVFASVDDHTRLAVCDGASESYASRPWATLLAEKFLVEPHPSLAWTNTLIPAFLQKVDYDNLSWSKQASFDRGSFSTLLGFEFFEEEHAIKITGIGDSVALLICDGQLLASFPYTDSAAFKQRPHLLSTRLEHNTFLQEQQQCLTTRWELEEQKDYYVLLLTDAIAEYTLRTYATDPQILSRLLALRDQAALQELVFAERAQNNMRLDDVTFVSIQLRIGAAQTSAESLQPTNREETRQPLIAAAEAQTSDDSASLIQSAQASEASSCLAQTIQDNEGTCEQTPKSDFLQPSVSQEDAKKIAQVLMSKIKAEGGSISFPHTAAPQEQPKEEASVAPTTVSSVEQTAYLADASTPENALSANVPPKDEANALAKTKLASTEQESMDATAALSALAQTERSPLPPEDVVARQEESVTATSAQNTTAQRLVLRKKKQERKKKRRLTRHKKRKQRNKKR